MTRLSVNDVGLVYRVRERLTLRAPAGNQKTGGTVTRRGRETLVTALDGVSFALAPGDRLAVTGPNGSGKTTLLKVLAGIYAPTRGTVTADGAVDALFDINLGFRPEATGRRNIVFRGLINGWSQVEINRRAESIIAFSELGDFIDMPVRTYSQGMAARLAFAIATSLDPEILIMDEWIGAGDAGFQSKASKRMTEFAGRAGIIVLASHNHALLRETCNRWLHLEQGHVTRFSDSIDDLP